jgi:enoyl-CoA hydratase/carnithine racemase
VPAISVASTALNRRKLILAGAGAAVAIRSGPSAAQTPSAPPLEAAHGQVRLERLNGGILLIGLDRPQAQNRLDPTMIIGAGKALYRLEQDDELRVGVLHGVGPDFCMGIDPPAFIAAVQAGIIPVKDPDYVSVLGLNPPLRGKPLVVAVQGGTQFAGHEYFLAADIRVAATDTVFRQAEVTRGTFPGGGATVRFTREAGWGNAMRYMLTGDQWGADEARRMGLVQVIAPPGQQLDAAVALAKKVAAAAPLGIRATIASGRQALAADQATALAAIQPTFTRLQQSEDVKEFQRAVREGQAPVFRGK